MSWVSMKRAGPSYEADLRLRGTVGYFTSAIAFCFFCGTIMLFLLRFVRTRVRISSVWLTSIGLRADGWITTIGFTKWTGWSSTKGFVWPLNRSGGNLGLQIPGLAKLLKCGFSSIERGVPRTEIPDFGTRIVSSVGGARLIAGI